MIIGARDEQTKVTVVIVPRAEVNLFSAGGEHTSSLPEG